jgi:hypothetical protein
MYFKPLMPSFFTVVCAHVVLGSELRAPKHGRQMLIQLVSFLFVVVVVAVLGFELRTYTLSHSTRVE